MKLRRVKGLLINLYLMLFQTYDNVKLFKINIYNKVN